jgi:MYXO-CTERM domain-containing protein
LTFALLGLLSTYLNTNLRWAYIPAAVMLVLGLLVVTPFAGAANYVWALALIGVGAYLVLRQRRGSTALTPTPPASTHATAATNNGAADYGQVVDSVATMPVKEREVVDIN